MNKKFLLGFLLLVTVSCKDNGFEPIYDVPDELQYIIDRFEMEAQLRGREITIDNLILIYDDNLALNICGSCNANSTKKNEQKIIKIRNNANCWNFEEELEVLIFHELGHCILGRDHDNRLLPNGDPRSIMVIQGLNLYNPCIYPVGGQICGSAYKRPYYMDELFNEATTIPDWAL